MLRGRRRLVLVGVAVLVALGAVQLASSKPAAPPAPTRALTSLSDSGDSQVTSSYAGPSIRRRVAVAIHTLDGVDRAALERQLRVAAGQDRAAPLEDATFAVFSEQFLNYLIPDVVVVLPETASLQDGERLMRNHSYSGVGYYLVDSVLVHDIELTVETQDPAAVRTAVDQEGILTDSFGKYTTVARPSSVSFRYFGAVLSDSQVQGNREAIARAAHVSTDVVAVEAVIKTGGADLTKAQPEHHHG